jgi:hypothetical protein
MGHGVVDRFRDREKDVQRIDSARIEERLELPTSGGTAFGLGWQRQG